MTMGFKPASEFKEQHGLFVSLTGGTNSGKSFSSLRLARGIAGPKGKVAAVDTEGGRLLHLKKDFDFDVMLLSPPHRPERYMHAAQAAQDAGYDALVVDSWTQQWRGIGGILDWAEDEATAMIERKRERAAQNKWRFDEAFERDKVKMASLIKPKMAHKLLVNGLLGLRIPIIFSIRGEISVDPNMKPPKEVFKPLCDKQFPFEMTVSFRLSSAQKGVIDLSDPTSWKMEKAHQAIFRDGDLLSEEHGAKLIAWARGQEAVQQAQRQPQRQAAHEPELPPQPASTRRTLAQYLDECLEGCREPDDVLRLAEEDPFIRGALADRQKGPKVQALLDGRYQALLPLPPEPESDPLGAPLVAA